MKIVSNAFLADAVFWERLADMPYVEALEELQSRRAQLVQERADLEHTRGTNMWDGERDQQRAAQLNKIGTATKRINEARNRVQWKDAVKALFGTDGYEQCAVWIAQQDALA